jgi:hypothetical protein
MVEFEFLTLDEVIAASLPEKNIEIPEWGGWVKVRAITSAEMERARRQATNPRNDKINDIEMGARIVEIGCVEPKFAPGQYKVVMDKQAGVVTRLQDAIIDLSGLGGEPEEVAEEAGEE